MKKSSDGFPLGAVYTPLEWAEFAVEKYGLLSDWLAGKTVFDPSMGEGNLLSALVERALKQGIPRETLPLHKLFGAELSEAAHQNALALFKARYNVDMRHNFLCVDFLLNEQDEYPKSFTEATFPHKFDILFGNPPWRNFVDLPEEYKESIKPLFFEYDLVENAKNLLLGGSRIDIAALFVQKSITDTLIDGGKAVFFLPLSLLLNDGAHTAFRKRFTTPESRYSLCSVYDFERIPVFPVSTRYGLALFEKKPPAVSSAAGNSPAIPYFRLENGEWRRYEAVAGSNGFDAGAPYLVFSRTPAIPEIAAPLSAKPRQGINPCGAARVFMFDECRVLDETRCETRGADGGIHQLPQKYLYPLITSPNFSGDDTPRKWALLPYNAKTGRPLSFAELEQERDMFNYLKKHEHTLKNRKGTLIQSHIRRGVWWALLGVGAYNFTPYKIVWEAYGKKAFIPRIFAGNCQANQSLQAFIPCCDKVLAENLLASLSDPSVEEYLRASRMDGTMNWAQPGKIRRLMRFF